MNSFLFIESMNFKLMNSILFQPLPYGYVTYGNDVLEQVILCSRDDDSFLVKVEKLSIDRYWFAEGWSEFITMNKIRVGMRLIFYYDGNSLFDVIAIHPEPDQNGDVGFNVQC